MKQVIPAVKGTRDFYPEDLAFRNWFYQIVKSLSEKYGYQEYDGPEIEYLDLYAEKTSQEILQKQVFILKDRDERLLALRPELTPTFARMVAQKAGQLPREIRWFSFGRAWRYEQPQKGRTREFFQWEINLLGPETPEADAEILAIAAQYFQALGLTPEEVVIKVSDREFIQKAFRSYNLSDSQILEVQRIIDRMDKIAPEEFNQQLIEAKLNPEQIKQVKALLEDKNIQNSPWLSQVFKALANYPSVIEYLEFDPKVMRGFDYYTRTVFEAWDKQNKFGRAIFGGGRFDNLTAQVGGDRVPGVGMAPGDVPAQVILEEYGKMPHLKPVTAQVLVTVFSRDLYQKSLQIANSLRSEGINTESWTEPETKLEKQLKYADQKGIPFAIIIGPDEAKSGKVALKDLVNKTQETLSFEEAIKKIQP